MALRSPWRADFPGLENLARNGQVYLDSAATAQKPAALIEALDTYLRGGVANVHRATHGPGERATQALEHARQRWARWLDTEAHEIIFTRGTTEAINLLAYSLEASFQPGDRILISALEHHANLLPWQQLAARRGLSLDVLPLTPQGDIDLPRALPMLDARTRLLAVSQISNVLGRWTALPELLQQARAQGILTLVDGAQGAVHQRPMPRALDCDFYVFSTHKLYGPEGLGILYGRSEQLAALPPWQFGGEMLRHTDFKQMTPEAPPLRFEAGTPPIGAILSSCALLDYLERLDPVAVFRHEQTLLTELTQGLKAMGAQLLAEPQAALVSFNLPGIHPQDLGQLLSEQGIAVRAGQHCAMPLFQTLGLPGAVRVSLGLYNDGNDLRRFFAAMHSSMGILG